MTPKNNNDAIAKFATLANVVTVAASKVSALSVQLAECGAVSKLAASQITSLSRSSTQLSLGYQAVAQRCQYDHKPTPSRWQTAATYVNVTPHTFLTGTRILAAEKIWGRVLEPLPRSIWLALAKDKLLSVVRWTLSLGSVVIESKVVPAALQTVTDVVAARATTGGAILACLAMGGTAGLGGISYLLWRHWNGVLRAIRKVSLMAADDTRQLIDKVRSFAAVVAGSNSEKKRGRLIGRNTSLGTTRSWYKLVSENGLAAALVPAGPSLASMVRPESFGLRAANITVRTAAAAMLVTPLLVTPATADVASLQPRTEVTRAASVVINSTPTITINSSNCEDIEQRVLEALKKHREELYAQWCNELQRRQRTEF